MSWLSIVDASFCVRLMLTLAHFLWQGAAIALAAGLTLLALPRSAAKARYLVLVAALIAMAMCPPVSFVIVRERVKFDANGLAPASLPLGPGDLTTTTAQYGPKMVGYPAGHVESTKVARPQSKESRVIAPLLALVRRFDWRRYAPLAVATYALVALLLLGRVGAGLYGGRRLRLRAQPVQDFRLQEIVAHHVQALRLRFTPVVAWCQQVIVPTVVGVVRPTILLPLSLASGLEPNQLNAILAHELAHIVRYDHVVNLLQRLVEAFLFYHPAVWFISSQIRLEREHCCDDQVISLGARPLDYAASLLHVAELSRASDHATAEPAIVGVFATGRPSQLRDRIARLLDGSADARVRLDRGSMLTLTISVAVALIAPVMLNLWAAPISVGAQVPAPGDASERSLANRESGAVRVPRNEVSPDAQEGWGEEKDGLRTRLVLITEKPAVGEPLVLRLEIKNFGTVARKYDPQIAAPFRIVRVARANGQPDDYIGTTYQTSGSPQPINPGESKVLWDSFDAAAHFLLAEPGRYRVATVAAKYLFHGVPGQPDEMVSDIPASNQLTIELGQGILPEPKLTFERLRKIAPDGWRASLVAGVIYFTHSPTGLKKDVTMIQLWFEDQEHRPGYTLGEDENKVPVESLGKMKPGFAYLTTPAGAAKLWPDYRETIRSHLMKRLESARDAGQTVERPSTPAPGQSARIRSTDAQQPLIIRLHSDLAGQWTGLEIGGDSKPGTLEELQEGLEVHLARRRMDGTVRIEADQRMRYKTVLEVLQAVKKFGTTQIEFAPLTIPRAAQSSEAPRNRTDKIGEVEQRAIDALKRFGNFEIDTDQPGDTIGSIVAVHLGGSRIRDTDLEPLKCLPFLRIVELSLTRVTSRGVEQLTGLTELEELYLGGTQVSDYGVGLLKSLPKLRVLYLGGTPVTDQSVQHLKEMNSLAEVDLYGSRVTEAGIQVLQTAKPNLRIRRTPTGD